jgi:gliding motility-associated-like protein
MVTPLDTNITLGDTVQLNSTLTGAYPGATYTWTPSTGLSCTNCPDPVLIPVDTFVDTYKLIITYNNGCLASDSAIVKATADDVTGLPTAFTPNGDGKNDVFVIRAIGVKDFKMNIYNRWGEQVFSTTDINVGWDGNYKGSPQPSEAYTYFFTLGYLDGKVITHEGSFMLLR